MWLCPPSRAATNPALSAALETPIASPPAAIRKRSVLFRVNQNMVIAPSTVPTAATVGAFDVRVRLQTRAVSPSKPTQQAERVVGKYIIHSMVGSRVLHYSMGRLDHRCFVASLWRWLG